jgi:enoyl-CoA hydratase/carnithine racemase
MTESAPDGSIDVQLDGHVATIRINRPHKANAVTPVMATSLTEVCGRLDRNDDVRVIVLTGAGKTFSAGSDLKTLDDYMSPWHFRARVDYCDAIWALRKPTIAAVNGAAFGGGLEMAISCDIRLAADTARFAAPEISLGWVGGGGSSQLLSRICGTGDAAEILFTGDSLDAQEALRRHLVQAVVPSNELMDMTDRMAHRIASNAPIALQATKAALRASQSMSIADGMQYEEELVAVCMATRDRNEGIAAFFEKRPPVFQGR